VCGSPAALPPLQRNPLEASVVKRCFRSLRSLALLAWGLVYFGSHLCCWVLPSTILMTLWSSRPYDFLFERLIQTWACSLTLLRLFDVYASVEPGVYEAVRRARVRIIVSNHRAELDLCSLPALIGGLHPDSCGQLFAIANSFLVEMVPFIGWTYHYGGILSIFYNQKERNARTLDKVVDLLKSGKKSWFFFFPEGNTWSPAKARKGSAQLQAQIANHTDKEAAGSPPQQQQQQQNGFPALLNGNGGSNCETTDSSASWVSQRRRVRGGTVESTAADGSSARPEAPNLLPLYWGCYDRLRDDLPVSDDVCWLEVTSAMPDVPNRLAYTWRPPCTLLGHPSYPDYLIMHVRLCSACDVSSHESLQRMWARKSQYLDRLANGDLHVYDDSKRLQQWTRLRFWTWWNIWGLGVPLAATIITLVYPLLSLLWCVVTCTLLLTVTWTWTPYYTPPVKAPSPSSTSPSTPSSGVKTSASLIDAARDKAATERGGRPRFFPQGE